MKKYIALFAFILVVSTFIGFQYVEQFGWTLNHGASIADNAAAWGAFGDYIGGIMNPIVAGIGLIFFIITLRQNEKALNMSAEELKLTRKELSEAKEAQKDLAASNNDQLKNSLAIRKMDEINQSHDNMLKVFQVMLESSSISLHFKGLNGKQYTINDALEFMYRHRVGGLIPQGNRYNRYNRDIVVIKELCEAAMILSSLYSDVKTANINAYRPEGYEKSHVIPSSMHLLNSFSMLLAATVFYSLETNRNEILTSIAEIDIYLDTICRNLEIDKERIRSLIKPYS